MRRLTTSGITASILSTFMLLGLTSGPATADNSSPPAAPTDLSVVARTGKTVPEGGWTSSGRVRLRFAVQAAPGPVTPEVEFEPVSTAFTGQSNYSGSTVSAAGNASVAVDGLTDGTSYHWQARVVAADGTASDWVAASGVDTSAPDFGVDQTPPTRPMISSPSNPNPHQWYHNRVVELRWSATDASSGILGYTYVLERNAHVIPPGSLTQQRRLSLGKLGDGVWFLAMRAEDRAGNWSPTGTYQIQLDHQVPQIVWMSPRRFSFNPYRGSTTVQFRVTEDAGVSLQLFRVGNSKPAATYAFGHLRAGQVTTISWNGKDRHGKPVTKGYYFFSARAVDKADNVFHVNLGGIDVNPQQAFVSPSGQTLYPGDGKKIIVSLSRQMLYAYDGVKLIVQTVVTTGNPSLPTPPGSYNVMGKYHPYEFISPWPLGSPYYYPPSLSNYALLFRDGGYFLHDAPWRAVFGPGSNGPGQPGSNYGGTHGCINIPPAPMFTLFNWADVGTPVAVVS